MKILLSGGAGFIGSHIAEILIDDGHTVHVVDDLSTGKIENLPDRAIFHEIDIRAHAIAGLFETHRFDVLCHYAAQVDVRASVSDPGQDVDINVGGLLNLMEAGRRYGLKKVLFASTGGAIYGEPAYAPQDENHPIRPLSPYGINKLTGEHFLYYYEQAYGISYVALRYANVYGPRQNAHGEAGVIAIFSKTLLQGMQATIFGDGNQTRDFVFVRDVAEANRRALAFGDSGSFNIGTGIETSINEAFALLSEITGCRLAPHHAPAKPGEQRRSVLDSRLASQNLGWFPRTSLQEGLQATVSWFKSRHPGASSAGSSAQAGA